MSLVATIARYQRESDARRRAKQEGLEYRHVPSETWPEYPWAVQRGVTPGVDGEYDKWAERLLEGEAAPAPESSLAQHPRHRANVRRKQKG